MKLKYVCVVVASVYKCAWEKMPGCAVAGCTTYSRKTKGTGIIYHSFPKDPQLQKTWILKCRRKDHFSVSTSTVCSQHFTANDYVRDLRAELLNLPPRKVLKPDVVPSVNIPGTIGTSANSTPEIVSPQSEQLQNRIDRCHAREVRKRAIETLNNLSPKKRKIDQSTFTGNDLFPEEIENLRQKMKRLEDENRRLNALCSNLKFKNKCLIRKFRTVQQKLNTHTRDMKKQVKTEVR